MIHTMTSATQQQKERALCTYYLLLKNERRTHDNVKNETLLQDVPAAVQT